MNALQVKASNGALSNDEQGNKSLQPTVVVSLSAYLCAQTARHMALWHATHSVITSHIPWNTSSSLSLLVVPGSQSRPPPPALFPSPAPSGAYPWASVAPTAENHKQPELSIELSLSALMVTLDNFAAWCV
ncbi:hypothetical protein NQZ68_038628 [Dissostichus eleginoides]|nr:hypothetical protein NQZ68_038628 [Dissostichus eleginoides]